MKHFFILLILTTAGVILWFCLDIRTYTKSVYLDEKVLDMASPLNVNIDIEFLRKLDPAYEQ